MSAGTGVPLRSAPRVEDLLRPAVKPRSRWPRLLLIAGLAAIVLGAFVAVLATGTGYAYGPMQVANLDRLPGLPEVPDGEVDLKKFVVRQKKVESQAKADLDKLAPQETYIVVDQTLNRLYLRNKSGTVLEAVCSAGSGMVLRENPGAAAAKGIKPRQWVFDTPRGMFKVKGRKENPVWTKPDWARAEEGTKGKKKEDWVEEGTLGEYALELGDGYMIHGTLYTRLLGRSVTHGCIRLGKDDLRRVWSETRYGTPVFIY